MLWETTLVYLTAPYNAKFVKIYLIEIEALSVCLIIIRSIELIEFSLSAIKEIHKTERIHRYGSPDSSFQS